MDMYVVALSQVCISGQFTRSWRLKNCLKNRTNVVNSLKHDAHDCH